MISFPIDLNCRPHHCAAKRNTSLKTRNHKKKFCGTFSKITVTDLQVVIVYRTNGLCDELGLCEESDLQEGQWHGHEEHQGSVSGTTQNY